MAQRIVECREALARLNSAAASLRAPANFMEVCGTHTVNAFRSGLHSLMPGNVKLLSGPGCPVCVTSQGEIDLFIELALRPGITLCSYGDMLRVTGSSGSLEKARSQGADVRIVYSPMDAVELAAKEPQRQVAFAAVGFETTTPPTAIALLAAQRLGLKNFSALVSGKRMPVPGACVGDQRLRGVSAGGGEVRAVVRGRRLRGCTDRSWDGATDGTGARWHAEAGELVSAGGNAARESQGAGDHRAGV